MKEVDEIVRGQRIVTLDFGLWVLLGIRPNGYISKFVGHIIKDMMLFIPD